MSAGEWSAIVLCTASAPAGCKLEVHRLVWRTDRAVFIIVADGLPRPLRSGKPQLRALMAGPHGADILAVMATFDSGPTALVLGFSMGASSG